MGLTHSFAADEASAAPARTFSASALPDDDTLILRKKPRTDALAALKCGADDDLVQKYDELLETFDAEQARFSRAIKRFGAPARGYYVYISCGKRFATSAAPGEAGDV